MKKYDSYKDSGIDWIGEIPTNWNIKKLKFISKICNGQDQKAVLDDNGIYPVYGSGGIFGKANSYLFDKPSVLLGRKGTIDKPQYVEEPFWTVDTSYYTKIHDGFSVRLFYYLCTTINFELYKYGSAIPSMTQGHLNEIKFAIPETFDEQINLANYLDHKTTQIEHLIAKKEQFIQLLEEERVAVINQAVTKGLDPNVAMNDSGIELLGEIPKHWEVKKLKQIFNSSKGLTITKENLESEGIPCVNYGEIHSKFGFEVDIDKHQLKCVNPTYLESDYKSLIQTGDFVFADTSEDVSGAGNFTYLKSNHEIFAGYHTIILRALVDIESRYFAYQFDSIPYRTQIRQSVKGIKVFSITQGILKNTSLWIPPIDEQKQIIEFLDIETKRIVSLKNSAVKEIELLKEFKTALISEVVTGKIDVRNEKLS
jgi:type I restriction enzyme S subunit